METLLNGRTGVVVRTRGYLTARYGPMGILVSCRNNTGLLVSCANLIGNYATIVGMGH